MDDRVAQHIDVELYPIQHRDSGEYAALVQKGQQALQQEGAYIMPGFLTAEALSTAVKQAEAAAPKGFHNTLTGNAYLGSCDDSLPADHPKNMTETTALAAVAGDLLPPTDLVVQIYHSEMVRSFVEAVIGRGTLYPYACPLGAINIAVMKPGDYLRWHFDQSDFVVSINLQSAQEGGRYEYVNRVRTENDPNFDGVKNVLLGRCKEVKELQTPPGSLVLFEGRYTIHRVTEIKGDRLRLGALFGYGLKPDIKSDDYLKKIRYGRLN